MTNFPAANSRVPDLYNLIRINKEIAALEEDVLDARYDGFASITVSDTTYTDTTVNSEILLDVVETGSVTFVTLTETVTLPGTTLNYNDVAILFYIDLTGTAVIVPTDTPISVSGNLILGSTVIALTDAMTLANIVTTINDNTDETGIVASTVADGANVKLYLKKDNIVQNNTLIVGSASSASILTELGLTVNDSGYVVNLSDAVAQIGSDASVNGAGPYSLQLDDAAGISIIAGTSLVSFGISTTIDLAADTIRVTGHGLTSGNQITFGSSATLPVPLVAFPDSIYYVIVVDVDTVKIATTPRNSLNAVALDLTQHATDAFTIKKTTDAEIYYQVSRGYVSNDVYQERYDEVIKYFEMRKYIIYASTNPTTNTTFQWVISW